MSRLSKFLGQGTCLPDAPVCAPLRRDAELIREEQDAAGPEAFAPCERGGPCPRSVDLPALKRVEVARRTYDAVIEESVSEFAALLKEAADAHHNYEVATGDEVATGGGHDDEWPTWYAKYLLGEEV